VFIKGDHFDFVFGPQLINKSDCRVLNILDLSLGRRADVEHKDDRERLLNSLKQVDLLLGTIFEDPEILLPEARDEPTLAIKHRNRHRYEVGFDTNDLIITDCLVWCRCRLDLPGRRNSSPL
jgi:hypothetical protein